MMGSMLRRGAIDSGCAATSAPPVPEDLELAVPGVILPTSADMVWSSGTGPGDPATSYVLEASDDSFSTVAASVTTTSTSATLTGLNENVYYDFRVKAVNCFGDSAYHDALSGETTPLKTPTGPGSAAGLGATVSGTTITLDWDDESSAETGYQIERSTDGVSYSLIHTTAAGVETYADTGLAAGTYYYRVRAYDSVSTNSSAWLVQTGSSTVASSTYNVEYLVVAGGGGGARGGGGAGGYRTATGFSLTVGTSYTVTVGAGGSGGVPFPTTAATNGSNSVFSTITSTGGGRAGNADNGASGGSGGGGGVDSGNKTGGAGTSGEGNAGGDQTHGSAWPLAAAGGGGASAAGGNSTSGGTAGSGGAGTSSTITGSSVTYAGGGGGGVYAGGGTAGTGGSGGGGGGGASPAAPTAGTVNRGGGGGGGNNSNSGAAGGSGVVIIRMATSNAAGVTTTGSPSITTSGSDTIYTFTASGTLTA